MNALVSPRAGVTSPASDSSSDSSTRAVVVPTAITRRPSRRAREMAAAACGVTSNASGSTVCSSTSSVRTGLNVP